MSVDDAKPEILIILQKVLRSSRLLACSLARSPARPPRLKLLPTYHPIIVLSLHMQILIQLWFIYFFFFCSRGFLWRIDLKCKIFLEKTSHSSVEFRNSGCKIFFYFNLISYFNRQGSTFDSIPISSNFCCEFLPIMTLHFNVINKRINKVITLNFIYSVRCSFLYFFVFYANRSIHCAGKPSSKLS